MSYSGEEVEMVMDGIKDGIINSLQFVISFNKEEMHILKNQNQVLQKRNTDLVEENRILKAHLKAIKEGKSHVQIDSFGNIKGVDLE